MESCNGRGNESPSPEENICYHRLTQRSTTFSMQMGIQNQERSEWKRYRLESQTCHLWKPSDSLRRLLPRRNIRISCQTLIYQNHAGSSSTIEHGHSPSGRQISISLWHT